MASEVTPNDPTALRPKRSQGSPRPARSRFEPPSPRRSDHGRNRTAATAPARARWYAAPDAPHPDRCGPVRLRPGRMPSQMAGGVKAGRRSQPRSHRRSPRSRPLWGPRNLLCRRRSRPQGLSCRLRCLRTRSRLANTGPAPVSNSVRPRSLGLRRSRLRRPAHRRRLRHPRRLLCCLRVGRTGRRGVARQILDRGQEPRSRPSCRQESRPRRRRIHQRIHPLRPAHRV